MLSNYSFKTFYSTATDDIPEIFYNRALEETNYFDRVSGYFSSSSLAYYSKGIENLIKNNGKYRLIISHELSESDYLSILEGYKNKQDALANQLISRLYIDGLSDEQKRNFTNLAYLIEIGLVDIKIGFTKSGLFHAKFGLFRDLYDNIVYFSGSLNETEAAFRKNYEEITVLKSWESNYEELQQKTLYFEKLWNNSTNDNMLFVKSINEIIKSKIISFSQGKLIVDNIIFK
ncbi:TPA: DNA/RNA helicase, partial [Streptococcus suis]|nr:DNA/RNA helicase [Streptococcus suis]